MTFNDIFKSGFLNSVSRIGMTQMLLTLAAAFVLGVFIHLIYKKTFSGVMYSASFAAALIALTIITAVIILAVTSNVTLSLGMVGALSIVRFRAAIKEPLDIVFLFWAISGGIVLAAGMFSLALTGSLLIGLVLLLFVRQKARCVPYMLVLQCEDGEPEAAAMALVKQRTKRCLVKCKTVHKGAVELNLELRLMNDDTGFINRLTDMQGVHSAALVSYNGEYAG